MRNAESMITETRQHADDLVISQTPLGGNLSAISSIVRCEGHGVVKVMSRSDVAGTVNVFQAVSSGAFALVVSIATTADPVTGEQVVFRAVNVFGKLVRVVYANGPASQAAFECSGYLVPLGGPSP